MKKKSIFRTLLATTLLSTFAADIVMGEDKKIEDLKSPNPQTRLQNKQDIIEAAWQDRVRGIILDLSRAASWMGDKGFAQERKNWEGKHLYDEQEMQSMVEIFKDVCPDGKIPSEIPNSFLYLREKLEGLRSQAVQKAQKDRAEGKIGEAPTPSEIAEQQMLSEYREIIFLRAKGDDDQEKEKAKIFNEKYGFTGKKELYTSDSRRMIEKFSVEWLHEIVVAWENEGFRASYLSLWKNSPPEVRKIMEADAPKYPKEVRRPEFIQYLDSVLLKKRNAQEKSSRPMPSQRTGLPTPSPSPAARDLGK